MNRQGKKAMKTREKGERHRGGRIKECEREGEKEGSKGREPDNIETEETRTEGDKKGRRDTKER